MGTTYRAIKNTHFPNSYSISVTMEVDLHIMMKINTTLVIFFKIHISHLPEYTQNVVASVVSSAVCSPTVSSPHTQQKSHPALTQNTVDVQAQNKTGNTPWLPLSGSHGAHSCTALCQGRLPGKPHSTGQSVPSGAAGTGPGQRKSIYYMDPSKYIASWGKSSLEVWKVKCKDRCVNMSSSRLITLLNVPGSLLLTWIYLLPARIRHHMSSKV